MGLNAYNCCKDTKTLCDFAALQQERRYMRQLKAFTLAEVLITLAIIGVVAALTVPALMQSYKKKEYSTKLKKFYSVMQQAIELSTVQNGDVETWTQKEFIDSTDLDENEKEEARLTNAKDGFEFVQKYILPYMKYVKIEENQPVTLPSGVLLKLSKIYLNDGSSFYMKNGACIDIIYDVNGDKGPNTIGYDMYYFLFSPRVAPRAAYFASDKQYFGTYGYNPRRSYPEGYREKIRSLCLKTTAYCSELIYLDNWEYADDYPYKL